MVNFFRRLRFQQMKNHNSYRYLKYALGEVFLVVIGILIALQINNWNTDHQLQKEEIKLLVEMRYNLKNDLKDCLWNIDKQKALMRSNEAVLKHLEEGSPHSDSLKVYYGTLVYSTTQRRNMATYEHLKSKGIDLIRNDSLRRIITAVYSERYYYIEKIELEYDNPIQLHEVMPLLNEHLIIDSRQNTGRPIDLISLQQNNRFKGMLRSNIQVKSFMLMRYEGLKKDQEHLIQLIGEELKRRGIQ